MIADGDTMLPGAPGWVGASLLGLVLAWLLLRYIPQRDQNARYVVDLLVNELAQQREANRQALVRVCAEFRVVLERQGGPLPPRGEGSGPDIL